MIDEISSLLPSFDVISFDIFDTLLLRPLPDPQDVWRMVEETSGRKALPKRVGRLTPGHTLRQRNAAARRLLTRRMR